MRVRKDRAYAFEARLSSLHGAGCSEPGGTDRELLRYSGAEPLELAPGDGVLVPVEREVQSSADGSLTEAVFPVDCGVEAVPGLWTTGAGEGFVLLAAQELDYTLEPGDVVAEVRSGLVETAACDCGAVETTFLSPKEEGPCETCGVAKAPELSDGCFSCGSSERTAVRSYQGCGSCSRTRGRRSARHSRRCFQRPGCCYRPVWVRLIRAPSGGPLGGHLNPGKRPRGELVVGCTWGRSLSLGAASLHGRALVAFR